MEVELDVYSGKPNPTWEIPPDQASALLAKVGSQRDDKATMADPGLGYRGFILRSGDRTIRVYGGLIEIQDPHGTHIVRDSANLEATLAADARTRGYGNLVSGVSGAH